MLKQLEHLSAEVYLKRRDELRVLCFSSQRLRKTLWASILFVQNNLEKRRGLHRFLP